jgi:hypothetical protein
MKISVMLTVTSLFLGPAVASDAKQLYHCTGLGSCTHGDFETVCYAHDQEAPSASDAVKAILAQCKEALDRNGGNWTCTKGSISCHAAGN